jgi:DNA replication protein
MQFKGFAPGRFSFAQIPEPFFTEIVPQIDDLAELKLVLFCFWALPQKDGDFPHLQWQEFASNQALMQGLLAARPSAKPEDTLQDTLRRATERGVLLHVTVLLNEKPKALYFVNTERGRLAMAQIKAGAWQTGATPDVVHILPPRPNIYKLYEENIGPLTPMIADQLKDLETVHSFDWVAEAIQIAVLNNARNLRYVIAILERWGKEGKIDNEQARGSTAEDPEIDEDEFLKHFKR